jgi:hypothetical protein
MTSFRLVIIASVTALTLVADEHAARALTRFLLIAAGVHSLALAFATTWLLAQPASPALNRQPGNAGIVVARGLTNVRLQVGPSVDRLNVGPVVPLVLDAADFDEDGVADLVAGIVAGDAPLLALYRGNGDSIYGSDRAANPFFAPVTFELPLVPDFIASGDFDADGYWDVAVASRRASTLAWLPGNGQGQFEGARTIALPAPVTALQAGELNRSDGLTDLVVSVSSEQGSSVRVFAGPDGALEGPATAIDLPGPSSDLVVAQLDDDGFGDFAVLVGDELLIYHGNGEAVEAAAIAGANVSRHGLGLRPVAITTGRFDRDDPGAIGLGLIESNGSVHRLMRRRGANGEWQRAQVGRSGDAAAPGSGPDEPLRPVLVSSRVSASSVDDLIVVDRARHRIFVVPQEDPAANGGAGQPHQAAMVDLPNAPMAVMPMRLDGDAASDLVIFQEGAEAPGVLLATAARTFVVNAATDEPDCDITDMVCRIGPVDAAGKCMGPCTFRAALHEANVYSDLDAIEFALGAGTPSIGKQGGADWMANYPVTINGNTGGATRVHLDARGMGNTLILKGGTSTIRNLVITGGNAGVYVTTNGGNIFEGNLIGLDPSGTMPWGNPGPGILVVSPLNAIGGTTSAARNVISASGQSGIEIRNATGNKVLGNYIGTNAAGTADLGNVGNGIYLELAGNTAIGGTVAGSRNVISGNDAALGGIRANISPNLVVQGNYIGTTVSGNAALRNAGPGLRIDSGSNDIIGGTATAARNVIAANGGDGVIIRSINVSAKTLVQGNHIGAAANGTLLGNAGFGVAVQGTHDNTLGGTASGARNVIAGNGKAGVGLQFAGVHPKGNAIRGNSIYSNASLGVDLGADGVTANDACDADSGGNGRQNSPVLTSVAGTTTIQGSLNSAPATAFLLDFYSSPTGDPSGYGEGQTFLGSKSVTTNASCTVSFTATFSATVPAGHVVSATATDPAGNTSEFSSGVVAPGAVTVTVPNTAVKWGIGTVQRVQWSHNLGAGSLVMVEISRDGGATYSVMAASVKNAATKGTYDWTVTGPAATQARIRVSSVSSPAVADVSNVNFAIADPFVTVTKPTLATHVWTIGTTQTIQWSNNLGLLENVLIELSRDGGATYPIVLLSATPSDGKQSVVVQPAWATPSARVRITWGKNAAVSDISDQSFPVK